MTRRHADTHPESRELIEGLLGAWDQLADRAAEAQAAAWDQRLNWTGKWPTPPDGCEAVFLPTDVVDHYVSAEPPSGRWDRQASSVADACREAQARRGTTPTTPGGDPRDAVRLLDLAWGVIANADGWGDDTSWRQAAERWRDGYHRFLDALREEPTAPPAPTPPPAPDELRERIARAMFDRDGFAVRWDEASVNTTARYSRLADAVLAVLPTPLPVPPWPGAVLSGLCDEDGVPTWLAQAGNVQGEQVRGWRDVAWYRPDGHSSDTWVEVRAPRAVPEPETERVDALKVLRDRSYRVVWMKDHAAPACSIGPWNDDVAVWSAAECRGYVQPVAPDGTVEVLKATP